jgi:AraC-like DNA-binding protein
MQAPLLLGLTTGSALLLSFLLFNHPLNTNRKANGWLGLTVATIGLAMLEILLHVLHLQHKYQSFLGFIEVSRFLTAPALYLSILFFTTPTRIFEKKDLWHFVPFAAFLLFMTKFIITGQNWQFNEKTARIVFPILRSALPLQTVLYWLFSYRRLRQHQRNLLQVTASTQRIDLSWMKHFLEVLALVILVWLNLAFFNFTPLYEATPLLYLVSIYVLAYFSLRQQEIYPFTPTQLRELEPILSPAVPAGAEKQKRLSDSQVTYLKDSLERVMQDNKAFLDNELNLPGLAGKVGVSVHELSHLINEAYGENFYAFVNRYRVEEAKRLLLSEKYTHLTMLGIANQAGFNSKTTFNTAFKKATGQSPTEFVQAARGQNHLKTA